MKPYEKLKHDRWKEKAVGKNGNPCPMRRSIIFIDCKETANCILRFSKTDQNCTMENCVFEHWKG